MSNANRIRITDLEKRVAKLEGGSPYESYGVYLIDTHGIRLDYADLDRNGKAAFVIDKFNMGAYFGVMVVDKDSRELYTIVEFKRGTMSGFLPGDTLTVTVKI